MAGSPRRVRETGTGGDGGQAIVEFAISATILLLLLFGLIDISRAIYYKQMMTSLSAQGSSMASRGTSLSGTASALLNTSNQLHLATRGQVIVSSVSNNNGQVTLTGQVSQGGAGSMSLVGHVLGGKASLPAAAMPQNNQTVYVTEVFYKYDTITPLGKLLVVVIPAELYDAAYY